MIIKVNNKGISIDVSSSAELTKEFGTPYGTLNVNNIATLEINTLPNKGEIVEITDISGEQYTIHYSLVESVNGTTGFTTNLELYNIINLALFGL